MVTNGSDEGLAILFRATLGPEGYSYYALSYLFSLSCFDKSSIEWCKLKNSRTKK